MRVLLVGGWVGRDRGWGEGGGGGTGEGALLPKKKKSSQVSFFLQRLKEAQKVLSL